MNHQPMNIRDFMTAVFDDERPSLSVGRISDNLDTVSLARFVRVMRHTGLRREVEGMQRGHAQTRGRAYSEWATECLICYIPLDAAHAIITPCCMQGNMCIECFSLSLKSNHRCPVCQKPFTGSRRLECGSPIGWSSWLSYIFMEEWRTNRQIMEARKPVAAGGSDRESLYVTHDGSVLKQSSDGTLKRLTLGDSGDSESSEGSSGGGTGATGEVNSSRVCIISVDKGDDFYAAISEVGVVYTWGNCTEGQLGHGDDVPRDDPVPVRALSGVRVLSVSAGATHCIAVTDRGVAFVWGSMGDLIKLTQPTCVALSGIRVRGASAGHSHVLIVTEDGALYSFGDNTYGQLGHGGDGESLDRVTATIVTALHALRVASAAAGARHSVALTDGGSVLTWGGDSDHRSTTPAFIDGALEEVRVRYVSAGAGASCAVSESGDLFMWGAGSEGGPPMPMRVDGLPEFVETVSIGLRDTFVVTSSGRVFCCDSTPPRELVGIRCSAANGHTTRSRHIDTVKHKRVAQWERIMIQLGSEPAGTISHLLSIPIPHVMYLVHGSRRMALCAVNPLVRVLQAEISDEQVKLSVLVLLRELSTIDGILDDIVRAGAIGTLVSFMLHYDDDLITQALKLLTAIAFSAKNRAEIVSVHRGNGIRYISNNLDPSMNAETVGAAVALICALSYEEYNHMTIRETGTFASLVLILRRYHLYTSAVITQVIVALQNVASSY